MPYVLEESERLARRLDSLQRDWDLTEREFHASIRRIEAEMELVEEEYHRARIAEGFEDEEDEDA